MGNGPINSLSLRVRDGRTYYWRVSAVDASFTQGPESPEQSQNIAVIAPSTPTNFAATSGLQVRLSWTAPGDDGNIGQALRYNVQVRDYPNGTWSNVQSPPPVPQPYGSPEEMNVTGLTAGQIYEFQIQTVDHVQATSAWVQSSSVTASNFSIAYRPLGPNLGLERAGAGWGDFNGDGNLDFVVSGSSGNTNLTLAYTGNGSGNFTMIGTTSTFAGFQDAAVAIVNVEPVSSNPPQDAWVDFVVTGRTGSGSALDMKLYRQTSALTFSEGVINPAYAVANGALAFGDVDNDGDNDLAIMGQAANGNTRLLVLENNTTGGNGRGLYYNANWDLSTSSGVTGGQLQWADMNNDEFLDLVMVGIC
jgi:hypothetical protein